MSMYNRTPQSYKDDFIIIIIQSSLWQKVSYSLLPSNDENSSH